MSFYTEKAYEVSISKKLLKDDDDKEISSGSFHVGYYLLTCLKRGFDFINVKLDWPKTQRYIDFCEEICQQIDVTYMVRKLMFLDAAMLKLLEKHEVEALCLRDKMSLEKAKKMRMMHLAP